MYVIYLILKMGLVIVTFLINLSLSLCLPVEEAGVEVESSDLSHIDELAFGKPSHKTGEHLSKWNETLDINPEELGEYLEGDILFPSEKRNGLISKSSRWNDGEIPYEIAGMFTLKDIDMIEKAMAEYHRLTCIKFRKRVRTDFDYVAITNTRTGCWSSLGKIGGRQELNLQSPGCLSKIGTPIHELMHAAGFTHEQNRWERDNYVDIIWNNIQNGKSNNFKKSTKEIVNGYGVPYDFNSVMHYSEKAFSVNNKPTIVAKTDGVTMGQREGFSRGDVKKIREMYNCTNDSDKDKDNSNNNGIFTPGGLLSLIFG